MFLLWFLQSCTAGKTQWKVQLSVDGEELFFPGAHAEGSAGRAGQSLWLPRNTGRVRMRAQPLTHAPLDFLDLVSGLCWSWKAAAGVEDTSSPGVI